MIWFWDNYLPDKEVRKEIYASPLNATLEQLRGLPAALIQTAENDVLRDEAIIGSSFEPNKTTIGRLHLLQLRKVLAQLAVHADHIEQQSNIFLLLFFTLGL